MRSRALIHVNGPAGSGKTKFVECLVKSWQGFTLCVRGERDAKTKRAKSVAPKGHAYRNPSGTRPCRYLVALHRR